MIKEDQILAHRISVTNQKASGTFIDLNGTEKTLTIPALLVLRNDIAPKLESLPEVAQGVGPSAPARRAGLVREVPDLQAGFQGSEPELSSMPTWSLVP